MHRARFPRHDLGLAATADDLARLVRAKNVERDEDIGRVLVARTIAFARGPESRTVRG